MFEAKFLSTLKGFHIFGKGFGDLWGLNPVRQYRLQRGFSMENMTVQNAFFGSPTSLNNNGQFFLPFTGEYFNQLVCNSPECDTRN
ncbi:hypothetical protein D0466_15045 [Peribacillus glennii]|uniref:Uncharacterized protein n=1 Tax=Peribacillus glennii TaxID=2303991 RepID=A0A372LA69_9BACI|nr:hypothetical protein D0466_15045 [Peribacillus glennii]